MQLLGLVGLRFPTEHGEGVVTGISSWSPQYLDVLVDGQPTCRLASHLAARLKPTTTRRNIMSAAATQERTTRTRSSSRRPKEAPKQDGPAKTDGPKELERGDKVKVGDKAGKITGFTRDGKSIYVRFDEKGAGKFDRAEVTPA